MPDLLIQTAAAADADRCVAALTLAFANDPPCRWTWPDPQEYLQAFPRFVRAFGGSTIEQGGAHHVDGFAGVALWLPPGAASDESALLEVIQDTVAAPRRDAMLAMFEQMDGFHPSGAHWHLPLIGVDPAHRGKGIGSALLRHALRTCDEQHLPACLEATSPRSIPLYQRFGFEAQGTIQVADSPPIVPMLRRPG